MNFTDASIYLSVRSDAYVSKSDLKLKLLSLGATVVPNFDAANFVVYHNGSKSTIDKSHERNIPIVTPNWVNTSYEEQKFVSTAEFCLAPPKLEETIVDAQDENKAMRTKEYVKEERASLPLPSIDDSPCCTANSSIPREMEASAPDRACATGSIKSQNDKTQPIKFAERETEMIICMTGAHKDFLMTIINKLGGMYIENPLSLLSNNASRGSAFSGLTCSMNNIQSTGEACTPFDDQLLHSDSAHRYYLTYQDDTAAILATRKTHACCVLVDIDAEIVSSQQLENRTLKHVFSYLFPGVPTINPSWLYECLCHKKWVPMAPHFTESYRKHVKKQQKWEQSHGKVESTNGALPLQIFKDLTFYLVGTFEFPTKQDMVRIIELCGGTALRKKRAVAGEDSTKEAKAHPCRKKIFAVYADDDFDCQLDTAVYAPIHQSAIFDSIENCDCTFFINDRKRRKP